MLRQLSIKNFAIVESVTLEFDSGFNVLTGETGAGKSLIVDALFFLLGDRISVEMIREGEERAVVEALFQVWSKSSVFQKLSEWGMEAPGGELLVKREYVRSSGKTRSFINGEMATAAMISELGDLLVDIHGQHEHQAIFNPTRHRELVDAFGHVGLFLQKTFEIYGSLKEKLEELSKLGGDPQELERRVDLLKFQANEIESGGLAGLNEEELFNRFQRMKHGDKIHKHLSEALESLDAEGQGATQALGQAVARLRDAAKIDPELEKWLALAQTLQDSLNQLSFDLSRKSEGYSFNEEEFQEVSDYIDGLNGLKKKYGNSVKEILAYSDRIAEELKGLTGRDERMRTLKPEIDALAEKYKFACQLLTKEREKVGKKLGSLLKDTLKELGLPHAQLEVQVRPAEDATSPVQHEGKGMLFSPFGWDKVEFLFSANPGESLRPLAKVASGGEASRVMLALKTVLAENDQVETLIFDEIDTGVGARTASSVAELLSKLAKRKQVLCISHLAPIAGMGECHYQVSKTVKDGKTFTYVNRLPIPERIEELAKMLGGEPVSDTSRSHAQELYARMHRH